MKCTTPYKIKKNINLAFQSRFLAFFSAVLTQGPNYSEEIRSHRFHFSLKSSSYSIVPFSRTQMTFYENENSSLYVCWKLVEEERFFRAKGNSIIKWRWREVHCWMRGRELIFWCGCFFFLKQLNSNSFILQFSKS